MRVAAPLQEPYDGLRATLRQYQASVKNLHFSEVSYFRIQNMIGATVWQKFAVTAC